MLGLIAGWLWAERRIILLRNHQKQVVSTRNWIWILRLYRECFWYVETKAVENHGVLELLILLFSGTLVSSLKTTASLLSCVFVNFILIWKYFQIYRKVGKIVQRILIGPLTRFTNYQYFASSDLSLPTYAFFWITSDSARCFMPLTPKYFSVYYRRMRASLILSQYDDHLQES